MLSEGLVPGGNGGIGTQSCHLSPGVGLRLRGALELPQRHYKHPESPAPWIPRSLVWGLAWTSEFLKALRMILQLANVGNLPKRAPGLIIIMKCSQDWLQIRIAEVI